MNDKTKFPIVIIEGCDASGKSTLITKLMEQHPNNCYIHNAVTDDIESLHKNTIATALEASNEHWVFIDRLHLSEKIYGTVFRDGPSYDVDAFDTWLSTFQNIKKILCIVDKETVVGIHDSRKDKEMFDDVSKIWDMYNDVASNDSTWIRYNWKTDEIDLNSLDISRK